MPFAQFMVNVKISTDKLASVLFARANAGVANIIIIIIIIIKRTSRAPHLVWARSINQTVIPKAVTAQLTKVITLR